MAAAAAAVSAASVAGRVFFVTGASGTVGSGVACALLDAGAKVATSSRGGAVPDKLSRFGDSLLVLKGDIGNEDDAKRLLDGTLSKFGRVDHVVASIGAWWQKGPVTLQSLAEFNSVIHNLAGAHFVAAKTFLPALAQQQGSSYTIITGKAGEKCFPGSGLTTVGASALFGLSTALREEYKTAAVRVNELRIGMFVIAGDKTEKPSQISHVDVGRICARIAANGDIRGQLLRLEKQADAQALLQL